MTTDTMHPYVTVIDHACGHRAACTINARDREDAQQQALWLELRPCDSCHAEWLRKTSEAAEE